MQPRLFLLPVLALGMCLALLPAHAEESPEVLAQRKLLTDKSASVRLRAALTLAEANDAEAVSTLITLLAELPEESAREAEAFLTELAGEQAPKVEVGGDQRSREQARDAWARWWRESNDPALLKELEKRTLTGPVIAQAEALIRKLGDNRFAVREEAQAELKKLGPPIRPLLKTALKDEDPEIRTRSQQVLANLEKDKSTPLSPTVPRLLAIRKPKGAVEALLAFLPFAEDESLLDNLQNALNAVAFSGGKAHPNVVAALTDKLAVRRAAAAVALCHGPLTQHRLAVRKLLADSEAVVRLRTALALAGAKDPEAVPVLIRLVGELPPEGSSRAEAYLFELARNNRPKDLPEGANERQRRSKLWHAWHEQNQKTLVMPDRAARRGELGYTLLVMWGANTIREVDGSGKVRWEFKGDFARDAHVLSNDRVLLVGRDGTVSERNFKGDVLWKLTLSKAANARQVERLKNGNTFIAGMGFILEVTRDGGEVVRITRVGDIFNARRLPSGQIVVLTNKWELLRLDDKGKVLKTVQLRKLHCDGDCCEIRDDGSILVPVQYENTVIEYNAEGRVVRTYQANSPASAVKLRNGNLLLCKGEDKAYEINQQGKVVWECESGFGNGIGIHRARRR